MRYIPNNVELEGEVINDETKGEATVAYVRNEEDTGNVCIFMLPKRTFDILFHPAETHVERMWVELDHLRKQIDKLEKFLESDTYKNMNLTQQKIIQYPLSDMREYEHYLKVRYEAERMNPSFNKKNKTHGNN